MNETRAKRGVQQWSVLSFLSFWVQADKES